MGGFYSHPFFANLYEIFKTFSYYISKVNDLPSGRKEKKPLLGRPIYHEEGDVCLAVSRDSKHQISEIREISDADTQLFLQNNDPVGEDYTTQN